MNNKSYKTTRNLCLTQRIPAKEIPYLAEVQEKYKVNLPEVVISYAFIKHPCDRKNYIVEGTVYFVTYTHFFGVPYPFIEGTWGRKDGAKKYADMTTLEFVIPSAESVMKKMVKDHLKFIHGIDME